MGSEAQGSGVPNSSLKALSYYTQQGCARARSEAAQPGPARRPGKIIIKLVTQSLTTTKIDFEKIYYV